MLGDSLRRAIVKGWLASEAYRNFGGEPGGRSGIEYPAPIAKEVEGLQDHIMIFFPTFAVTLLDVDVLAGVGLRKRKALHIWEVSLNGQPCGVRSLRALRFEPTSGRPDR